MSKTSVRVSREVADLSLKGATPRGLGRAEAIIHGCLLRMPPEQRAQCRLLILHHCAALVGGLRSDQYLRAMGVAPLDVETNPLMAARAVVEVLTSLNTHPVLSLATLCTLDAEFNARRQAGAYYTDPRLATSWLPASGQPAGTRR